MPKRRLEGKVVSDKMDKTIVVAVERTFAHPVYKKRVRVTKRFKAHDESGAKVGDKVTIEETRPLSRQKRWRVIIVDGKRVGGGSKAAPKRESRGKKEQAKR